MNRTKKKKMEGGRKEEEEEEGFEERLHRGSRKKWEREWA